MTLQEKIDYLFTDKDGNPQIKRHLTIRKCKLYQSMDDKEEPQYLWFGCLTSDKILKNDGNIFHKMWGDTLDDVLDTLIEDKKKGFELPTDEEVEQWKNEQIEKKDGEKEC